MHDVSLEAATARLAPVAGPPVWRWRAALVTALVGTLAFYLPLVSALQPGNIHWPDFMLSHDQRVFYFPSFVEGYRRFWHGGISGLDFFTGDGASVYAFRPNLLPYYPPYLLGYLLFDCADLKTGMLVYLGINVLHEAVGLFFTVVFVRRYLGLSSGAAVLAATIFGLTYYSSVYIVFATFYFQMMLLPVAACTLCWLTRTRSRLAPVLASAVFVVYALTNYGPTMLAGLGLAVTAALTSLYVQPDETRARRWASLIRPTASLALAGLVCAPYFAGQLAFKAVIAPTADDIDQVAHSLAFSGFDLLNGLSQFTDIHRAKTESTIAWGAIPVFLCAFGLDVLLWRSATIAPRLLRAAGAAALVYLVSLSTTLGTSLMTVADAFYYAVPILGKMHIFQRYLIFSQFFFAIVVAAMASIAVFHATPAMRRGAAYAGLAVWLGVTAACLIWPPQTPTFAVGELLTELFLVAVAAIAVAVAPPTAAFLTVSALCAVVGLYSDYTLPLAFNKPAGLASEPAATGPEVDAIAAFVTAQGEGKALSKVVVASSAIPTYFNRNLPWLLGSRVRMMNFQGYPPHLAVLADYAARWSTYGVFDVPWMETAGVDFIYWNDATGGPVAALTSRGFTIGPTLDLPFGNHLGKLRMPSSATVPLLDLGTDPAKPWPNAMALDGWAVEGRTLLKIPGRENRFGYHVDQQPGHSYDVSLDVDAGSSGRLTIAFGNTIIESVNVTGSTHIKKQVTTTTAGDLWITAAPEFKGSLSQISVQAADVASTVSFDNGLLRVAGGDDPVQAFSTDYTHRLALQTEADVPVSVTYLLWPNPYMVPYLDGAPVAWTDDAARPVSLAVPAGRHIVEVRFVSRAATLFFWSGVAYLVLLAAATAAALARGRSRRAFRILLRAARRA